MDISPRFVLLGQIEYSIMNKRVGGADNGKENHMYNDIISEKKNRILKEGNVGSAPHIQLN